MLDMSSINKPLDECQSQQNSPRIVGFFVLIPTDQSSSKTTSHLPEQPHNPSSDKYPFRAASAHLSVQFETANFLERVAPAAWASRATVVYA